MSYEIVQAIIPAVDFVHKYENVFAFKCVLILSFPMFHGDRFDFLLVVRPSSPTWTKRTKNVAMLDMWTNTSNIHRVVFSLFLEARLKLRTGVIFGLRFSKPH